MRGLLDLSDVAATLEQVQGPKPPQAHEVCLLTPYDDDNPTRTHIYGFPIDGEIGEWQIDEGSCDCDCATCVEVRNGEAFYIRRYSPQGRDVVKCVPAHRPGHHRVQA
jgi:hypothetical protein